MAGPSERFSGGSARTAVRALPWRGTRRPFTTGRLADGLRAALEREDAAGTAFLFAPVAMGLGILAYFAAENEPVLWAGPMLLAVAALAGRFASGGMRLVLIGLACAAFGFSAATWRTAGATAPVLERYGSYTVKGHLETVDRAGNRARLTIRVVSIDGLDAKAKPRLVRIGAPWGGGFVPGGAISLVARLQPPSEAALPGGYDFRRESYFRGIGAVGFATGRPGTPTDLAAPDVSLRFWAAVDRARNALTDRIAGRIGGEAGALAAALVTGKRGAIPEATNEELRASGLYHIVSISGLHMVLAAGVLFWLVRAGLALSPVIALTWPIKKIAALAAMAGATVYCVFSGSEVATERSLLMTLVMLGAVLVDRPALALRNLAISALLVLAREPEALLGPSFQMSYAAVAALIAANRIWQEFRPPRERPDDGWLGRAARAVGFGFLGIVATTMVASLATAPFAAFHFHRVNPLGLIGNALAIPLVSLVVMPAGVVGTLLLPFGFDGPVWDAMGQGVAGVLVVASRVAALDYSVVPVARNGVLPFALTALALIAICLLSSRLRWAAVPLLALAALGSGRLPPPVLAVHPEGRMALVRGEDGRFRVLAAGKGNRFVLSQWLPALGDARRPDDPTLKGGVACDSEGCVTRLNDGRVVALVWRDDALRQDCGRADIVIAPLREPRNCAAGTRFSRETLLRTGAILARPRADGTFELETTLPTQGTRPWRRPRPAPPVTPPAETGDQ